MTKLDGTILATQNISSEQIIDMYALMNSTYKGMDFRRFCSDLNEKDHAIMLYDNESKLQGFSTLQVFRDEFLGKARSILYSGDTVINKSCWGSYELPRLWGAYAHTLMKQEKSDDCYWFLMSKGYKTYRFLPIFFEEYFPRPNSESDQQLQGVRDAFAQSQFGNNYDAETGIISFNGQRDRLKEGIADVDATHAKDPTVEYFVKVNPHWKKGDELACIAPLTPDNFKKIGLRMIRSGLDKICCTL